MVSLCLTIRRAAYRPYGTGWRPLLLVLFALFPFAATVADPPDGYPFVAYDIGLRQAAQAKTRVFLYFGRYGCGWCDLTNRQAFAVDNVRRAFTDHYVLVYVDAESGRRLTLPSGERITEMELGVRFNAFATPLFAFLEPDGRVIFKIAGIQTADDLLRYDRFVHSGIYRTKDFQQFVSDSP